MSDELKPCPFCGELPILDDREHHKDMFCWYVMCNNDDCPAAHVIVEKDEKCDAVEAWNRRAGEA